MRVGWEAFWMRNSRPLHGLERGIERAASTCQVVGKGGRRRQGEAYCEGNKTKQLQGSTYDGQQAPAQPLGPFCSFLGWQRGFLGSALCLEVTLLLPFLLSSALQLVLSVLVMPWISECFMTRPWNQPHSDMYRSICKSIYLSNCSFKLLADSCLQPTATPKTKKKKGVENWEKVQIFSFNFFYYEAFWGNVLLQHVIKREFSEAEIPPYP